MVGGLFGFLFLPKQIMRDIDIEGVFKTQIDGVNHDDESLITGMQWNEQITIIQFRVYLKKFIQPLFAGGIGF